MPEALPTLPPAVEATAAPFSSIEWRFSNTDLVSHNLMERNSASATLAGNLENAPLWLSVNGAGGDLHLAVNAATAIDPGVSIANGMSNDDIDRTLRDANPDLGADEFPLNLPGAVYVPLIVH